MTKKLLIFLFSITFPTFLFAQSGFSDCEFIFKKVQHLPSLKISNEAFEDTLLSELKSKNFPLKKSQIVYQFVVTDSSKIDELTVESGEVTQKEILENAILHFAGLWKPAVQNGYNVCSYVKLKLKFADKKINIEISQ